MIGGRQRLVAGEKFDDDAGTSALLQKHTGSREKVVMELDV